MATKTQLGEAGLADDRGEPERPWHRIQGPRDASTMWYAVFRRQMHGVFIATLCFRQAGRYASLRDSGWEELPAERIGV